MLLSENLRPAFNDSMIKKKQKTLMLTINLGVIHLGWWFTTQPKCPWFCQASDRVSCSSIYLTYPCHKHNLHFCNLISEAQSVAWVKGSSEVSSSTEHRYCTEVQSFASTGSQHSFSHHFPSSLSDTDTDQRKTLCNYPTSLACHECTMFIGHH